jgi:hypothetical protein
MVVPTGCGATRSAPSDVTLINPLEVVDGDVVGVEGADGVAEVDTGYEMLPFDWLFAYASAVEFALRTQTPIR